MRVERREVIVLYWTVQDAVPALHLEQAKPLHWPIDLGVILRVVLDLARVAVGWAPRDRVLTSR